MYQAIVMDQFSREVVSRINLFVNEMRGVDREKVLENAMEVLSPELRNTAFELAAEVVIKGNTLPDQKAKTLEELVTKMSIEAQFAATVIERLTNPTLSHSVTFLIVYIRSACISMRCQNTSGS